jgi:hypothetical protein
MIPHHVDGRPAYSRVFISVRNCWRTHSEQFALAYRALTNVKERDSTASTLSALDKTWRTVCQRVGPFSAVCTISTTMIMENGPAHIFPPLMVSWEVMTLETDTAWSWRLLLILRLCRCQLNSFDQCHEDENASVSIHLDLFHPAQVGVMHSNTTVQMHHSLYLEYLGV